MREIAYRITVIITLLLLPLLLLLLLLLLLSLSCFTQTDSAFFLRAHPCTSRRPLYDYRMLAVSFDAVFFFFTVFQSQS